MDVTASLKRVKEENGVIRLRTFGSNDELKRLIIMIAGLSIPGLSVISTNLGNDTIILTIAIQ